MMFYVIICALISLILVLFEIPCNQTGIVLISMNSLMFTHNFCKLLIWLSPLFVTNVWILGGIAGIWLYVCVQNVIRRDMDQPCILSNYVNKTCGQSKHEMLRDVLYHLGLKKDVGNYNKYFNIASWLLLLVILIKMFVVLRGHVS